MLSKCKDSNAFPPTLGPHARFVPLVTNRRDFRSGERAKASWPARSRRSGS